MIKKTKSRYIWSLLIVQQIHSSLEPAHATTPSINSFTESSFFSNDNQKYLFGAMGLTALGAGAYWWYKNTMNLDILLADHQKRTDKESSKNSEFQKFVQHFSPPARLLSFLVPYEKIIYETPIVFNRMQNSVLAKSTDLTRLIIAKRMSNYLQKKNYTSIGLPNKYIFLTGDIWTVIAERIHEKKGNHTITVQQMKELTDVIENMGYSDFDDKNLITDKNGKIFFIDTEDKSFISPIGKFHFGVIPGSTLRDEDTTALCKEKYLNLIYFNEYLNKYNYIQEKTAHEFLMQKIDQLKKQYGKSEETYTKVTGATDLDNYNVDINALNKYIEPLIQKTRGLRAQPRDYFTTTR